MDTQGYLEKVRLLPQSSKDGEEPRHVHIDQRASIALVLATLGFMYSVHNLIAPNMTALAKSFHFNNWERDTYIGGELTFFFYVPGVLGALLAGLLCGVLDRKLILAVLAALTSIACLLTACVGTFRELVWTRAMTGFGIGGSLPVVYSLVGDWFPAKRRASATAFVSAASGAGVFIGQCIATLAGGVDWRWPFFLIAFPSALMGGLIWYLAEEPIRGGQENGSHAIALYQQTGGQYMPAFSYRQIRALMHNRTNMLVILQAFPGNMPWGVIIVYLHDFLVQDLGLSTKNALGAITTLAASAFAGVLTGGFVGEQLYGANSRYLAIFGGVCNILRALPFFVIFGWTQLFGTLDHSQEGFFFIVLVFGGFLSTMASPCTGAMLLNVNLPETRGALCAVYSILDDMSKGLGTLFISMIVGLSGGRAVGYQISLLLWVFTGVALLYTWHTYDEDESQMCKNLNEAAAEAMVLVSKQRAQQAVRNKAKAAGEALSSKMGRRVSMNERRPLLQWTARDSLAALGFGKADDDESERRPFLQWTARDSLASLGFCSADKDEVSAVCTSGDALPGNMMGEMGEGGNFKRKSKHSSWGNAHRDHVRRAARAAAEAASHGRSSTSMTQSTTQGLIFPAAATAP